MPHISTSACNYTRHYVYILHALGIIKYNNPEQNSAGNYDHAFSIKKVTILSFLSHFIHLCYHTDKTKMAEAETFYKDLGLRAVEKGFVIILRIVLYLQQCIFYGTV